MTNQELERKLADAVLRAAPDDLEGVLSRCETRKGTVIPMKKKNPHRAAWLAACLALVLAGGAGGVLYQQSYAVASVVSLDVNPSIELTVNQKEQVLSCTALNDEAVRILADMGAGGDLEGAKLNVAVNAVVGALVRHGYLESISSALLISVEDKDQARAARLQQELTAAVDGVLQEQQANAAVLSQTVEKDAGLERQAKASSISTGKAALVNQVIALNGELEFDALAELSVEELKDLAETGAPGMPIGREAAAWKALDYAGLSDYTGFEEAAVAGTLQVDAELDDNPAHYDVDLYYNAVEYEYTVDAYTGQVLKGKAGILDAAQSGGAGTTQAAGAEAGSYIGEAEAFDLAAKHFYAQYPELSGYNILNNRTELDRDDGRVHYDVEFFIGGYEADYELDASTGAVWSWDTEYEGPAAAPATTPAATPTTTPDPAPTATPTAAPATTPTAAPTAASATDVGSDGAKAAALSHAGLEEAQVTRLKVEKDYEHGRLEYEVEFKAGGMEYEYTIDGATGAVLEHEKEWDD